MLNELVAMYLTKKQIFGSLMNDGMEADRAFSIMIYESQYFTARRVNRIGLVLLVFFLEEKKGKKGITKNKKTTTGRPVKKKIQLKIGH